MKQLDKQTALFLPLLQIPSGHHHVADTLIYELRSYDKQIICHKVDLLSYSYGHFEKVVSKTYLSWIKSLPSTYHWLYYNAAYKQRSRRQRYYLYEIIFLPFFRRLIKEIKPTIIVCTHALPSNMASVLKSKDELHTTVVNVYTDYFVNQLWGIEGVDYHFVPTRSVKDDLIRIGVDEKRIIVTGIPVHPAFSRLKEPRLTTNRVSVLVTGGNLGVGEIKDIVTSGTGIVHFFVLCGKNIALYEELRSNQKPWITPISYISCKKEMDHLYSLVDIVITKPGGVTISECLQKRKTIFLMQPLPGQERINMEQLLRLGLVIPLQNNRIEQQILDFYDDENKKQHYMDNIKLYHEQMHNTSMSDLFERILNNNMLKIDGDNIGVVGTSKEEKG